MRKVCTKYETKKKGEVFSLFSCALDWIRTSTPVGTTPSRWRVYQFHHQSVYESKIRKKKPSLRALVIPLGLEPRAHTLKVYCSTN